MRLFSFLSLGLSSSCLKGCTPSSSNDVQLADPARPENSQEYGAIPAVPRPKATDPTDPKFLVDHGYSHWVFGKDGSAIYSKQYNKDLDPVLELYIDGGNKVLTIKNNYLHLEPPHENKLDVDKILEFACHYRKVDFHETKWIDMFVHDKDISDVIQKYRKDKDIGSDEIKVTPYHADWGTFSETSYYKDAVKMMPGAIIDKILIRRQDFWKNHDKYHIVIAEVLSFSYKKEVPQDGNMAVDSTDTDTTEVAAEDTVSASNKAVENEVKADVENS
ncbi:hypothetical protein CFIMG_008671RA00001 [Ceratocystis fimbriata CBS 114723]|uniref:Lipoprotein n=1 Tax=Ceratocystis fimbriata CBS 114723 TaxID=1035309 RepID=A0A2C5X0H1_9PEZI|nr:hypothetical protein CFIMG_008671RA00001 [Ceratocystis fimbriata CBS 114723]